MENKGLWARLKEAEENPTPITFDKNILKEEFFKIFNKVTDLPTQRKVVIYTGVAGMFLLNLAINFGDYTPNGVRYWIETYKHCKLFAQISLFEKHGLYKIKVYNQYCDKKFRFEFYYGTTLLFTSDNAGSYTQLNYTGPQTPYHIKRKNEL